MSRSTIGWLWVAGQAILLGALILLPSRDDWPTPGWLETIASIVFFAGLATIGLAALRLGTALTPTPVPNQRGTLSTTGFYRYVRHPIYTGVLAVVAGMTLRSGSWIHLAIAAATVVFFDRKATWEEQQLTERFPDYPAYAATTPKFVPRPWPSTSRSPR